MNCDGTPLRVTVADEIEVVGELDAHTAPKLAEIVRSVPPGRRNIDATGVTFVGSSGLTLLLELQREAARTGDEISIRASDSLRRLASITGLDEILPLT